MSFLRWRKRKKCCSFSCMPAINAVAGEPAGAMLDFDLIEVRRLECGLSKQELADRVGVDQSTIWRYRRKGMVPHLSIAQALADVLGMTMDEVTGRLHPAHREALLAGGNPTPAPPPGPSIPKPPAGPKPKAGE